MDSIGDVLAQGRDTKAQGSKVYGVCVGIVTNNKDPDGLGRVKVKFPWLGDSVESWWARVAMPMAGPTRGFCFIPEVDDEVLCAFEHGDVRFPYVVGSLYNGQDLPPTPDPSGPSATYSAGSGKYGGPDSDGKIQQRYIKTRLGHVLYFDDSDDNQQITIVSSNGHEKFTLDMKNKKIVITSDDDDGAIELHAPNGKVLIDCKTLETHSSKDTTFKADQNMTLIADQGDMTQKSNQGNYSTKCQMSMTHDAGMDCTVKSGTSMAVNGGTTCDVKGGASLSCKSPMSTFSGDGQCTVKGGVVMIN
jgi:uncharacterized protein involved in type VI secretion and phage assembly